GQQIGVARRLDHRAEIDGNRVVFEQVVDRVYVAERDRTAGEPVEPRRQGIKVRVVIGVAAGQQIEVAVGYQGGAVPNRHLVVGPQIDGRLAERRGARTIGVGRDFLVEAAVAVGRQVHQTGADQ